MHRQPPNTIWAYVVCCCCCLVVVVVNNDIGGAILSLKNWAAMKTDKATTGWVTLSEKRVGKTKSRENKK